jgi:ribose transport system permease protein
MNAIRTFASKLTNGGLAVPLAFVIALVAVSGILQPTALMPSQLKYTVINASLALALAAAGLAIVVLIGGLDMSSAGVIALTNALLAANYGGSLGNQFLWIVIAILVGIGSGMINGLIVHTFRLEPVVVTLGTSFVLSGFALLLLPKPKGLDPVEGFSPVAFLTSDVAGLPVGLLLMALVVFCWFALRRSRFGSEMISIGSDREAAAYSGIRVGLVSVVSFGIAGGLYGLAGIAVTSQTSGGDSQLGAGYLLAAFTAVVAGGLRLGGGFGSVLGAVLGAITVTIAVNVVFMLGFASFWSTIARGALLLLALACQAALSAILARKQTNQSLKVEAA